MSVAAVAMALLPLFLLLPLSACDSDDPTDPGDWFDPLVSADMDGYFHGSRFRCWPELVEAERLPSRTIFAWEDVEHDILIGVHVPLGTGDPVDTPFTLDLAFWDGEGYPDDRLYVQAYYHDDDPGNPEDYHGFDGFIRFTRFEPGSGRFAGTFHFRLGYFEWNGAGWSRVEMYDTTFSNGWFDFDVGAGSAGGTAK